MMKRTHAIQNLQMESETEKKHSKYDGSVTPVKATAIATNERNKDKSIISKMQFDDFLLY